MSDEPIFLWKDELSGEGDCCPALYKVGNGYLVQGKKLREDSLRPDRVADDETVVFVPDNVLRRLLELALSGKRRAALGDRPFMKPWVERLIGLSGLEAQHHVMDYGCGAGFMVEGVAAIVGGKGSVVGVDRDPISVFHASRLNPEHDIRWLGSDLSDFGSSLFDVAYCCHSIQYFPDPLSSLRTIGRLLKPGGRLALAIWEEIDSNPLLALRATVASSFLTERSSEVAAGLTIERLGGLDAALSLIADSGFQVEFHAVEDVEVRCPAELLCDFDHPAVDAPQGAPADPQSQVETTMRAHVVLAVRHSNPER